MYIQNIKIIISPILGIISIGLFFLGPVSDLRGEFIYRLVALVIAILGLIWGIKGIRVVKSLAVIGILLSSIGLSGAIVALIVWLGMGGAGRNKSVVGKIMT